MTAAATGAGPSTAAEIRAEIHALRAHLDELAAAPDDDLTMRYALTPQPWPRDLYFKARRVAAEALAVFDALPIIGRHAWPASLRHAPFARSTPPLLVWGVDIDRPTLRRACTALAGHSSIEGFAPVLVTDVADFAFFSRLGWLVELVAPLTGEGESYTLRKSRHLAKLYKGAPALPASVGLELERHGDEIRRALEASI